MGIRDPWHEGIARDVQERIDGIARDLRWHVDGAAPTPEFVDSVVERCGSALASDPLLVDFVGYVHGVANGETIREFEAHGAGLGARRWAELGDRLHELTGREALGGP